MKKTILIISIIVIIILVVFIVRYILNTEWYDNTHVIYNNTEFNYAFQYNPDWHFIGDPISTIVQIYSTKQEPADGGIPLGSKIEVMVLENYDNLDLQEWVTQMTARGQNSENITNEIIRIAGQEAIQRVEIPREGIVQEGPPISIYLVKNNYIIIISYLSREPDYAKNKNEFQWVLSSFHFEN